MRLQSKQAGQMFYGSASRVSLKMPMAAADAQVLERTSFSSTLKCEMFHSVLLFLSPAEFLMDTLMPFHTT